MNTLTSRIRKRELPSFIPPVTDEDRKAAFPDVEGHAVHDKALNYFILFDQFEWQSGEGTDGTQPRRARLGRTRSRSSVVPGRGRWCGWACRRGADASALWSTDLPVVGHRRRHPSGLSSRLCPNVGCLWRSRARTVPGSKSRLPGTSAHLVAHTRASRLSTELLLTNRLIVQPLFEAEIVGKSDPERGVGAGLSTDGRRIPAPIRTEAGNCAVRRNHLEQQVGKDRRLC